MSNNREAMQEAFEGQKFKVFSAFKCDITKNEDGNYVQDETIFAFAWFCRGLASQAQQPTNEDQRAKLAVNMIKYLGATKTQAKAIIDGVFDGDHTISESDLQAQPQQEPAGWQRRLKFSTNGQVHQWELCKTSEATDNFERSPHHEYRQIFTMQSQAQQPTDLPKQLREYASDSGYSHNDYADTMLAAASEIERCAKQMTDLEEKLNYYKNMVGA